MELIFLRHFPTPGNKKRQYIGWTEESLEETSIADMMKKTEKLAEESIEKVILSPMIRCKETANLVFGEVPFYICEELKECNFGLFERKTYEELKTDPRYEKWLRSGGLDPMPEGEGREAFQKRCVKGFEKCMELLVKEGVNKAAFVVHGGTIMAIFEQYSQEKKEFYHWQVGCGEGYRCIWESGKLQKIRSLQEGIACSI